MNKRETGNLTKSVVKKYALHNNPKIIFLSFLLVLLNISCSVYAEEQKPLRFAVMGCMHLGACGFEDYESTIQKIKEQEPDFVLFLGGMVDPCGGESIEALWNKFDLVTDKLKVPVYNVPGIC